MTAQKRALVTGGHAGLGLAFCRALTEAGYAVTALDRTPPKNAVAWTHRVCDLRERTHVDAAIHHLISGEPFDLVIFNAGVSATGRFEKIPLDVHRRLIAVNVEAPIVLCSALARSGALKKGGQVVFISSLSHMTGYPGAASYAAAKDAIAIYANSIRRPFRRDLGVHVACAFPGPIRTAQAERHAPKGAKAQSRIAPEDMAQRILTALRWRRPVIVPGMRARLFALIGGLFPKLTARAMRRIVFDRLDREVW